MGKELKPAYIKWFGAQNGQERKATLRGGTNGKGKVLATVNYWPAHGASLDQAYKIFQEVAKRDGYEIIGSDRDEE